MAKILQPKTVVRIDKSGKWGDLSKIGYHWHLENLKGRKKTACGILFSPWKWERAFFAEVKSPRTLCSKCFSGLVVRSNDEKALMKY